MSKSIDQLQKENEQLREQLAEKDKEIKELKTQFDLYRSMNIQKGFDNPDVMKALRHEICEEIRNIAGKYWTRLEDDNEQLVNYYITTKDLDNIIDEIEGE